MATEIDLGDEDGFVVVKFCGAEVRLDLYDANDKIAAALAGKESDDERASACITLAKSLGLPEMSRRAAVRFVNGITGAVRDAEKKASGTAASPASTASTPPP